MLMQAIKSAADLGISEEERSALITVLGMFERGEVVAAEPASYAVNGFHMRAITSIGVCGTCACIAGWCQIVGGPHLFDIYGSDIDGYTRERLYLGLFMYGDRRRFKVNDPAQAAMAIRSYLTTGHARWDLAIKQTENRQA